AWTVCGVGLMPGDRRLAEALPRQGHRYPLVLRHPDGRRTRQEVRSVTEVLHAPDDPWAVVERMADPGTRVVSLTITEGGWALDPASPDLLPGAAPSTPFGLVVTALRLRRQRGLPAFPVVSCDNVEGNGAVARAALVGWARRADPELGAWVEAEVAFPSSMVDRITPATTDADRAEAGDDCVVVAEPWRQWVLEDRFPLGRPALERVGVQLVEDVRPYELMKLRLLNAGHQALAYAGVLLGHELVHDAAADPAVQALLRRYWSEARPSLDPVPGIDLDAYEQALLERFTNAHVADTLARLCAFSSDRIPGFLLPVLRDGLAHRRDVGACVLVLATWARWLEVASEVVDHRVLSPGEALLGDREVLGDLGDDPAVRDAFTRSLAALRTDPRRALAGG
ncbi:MAG: mannitol dehydrogenase family protein, partial [Mycobacteriales bacterium]